MVYAGTIDSMNLTFQSAGSVWRDALVIEDIETGSLWSQVTGECISGKLEDSCLALLPSMLATYSEYKKLYPNGEVLAKPDKGSHSPYDWYAKDADMLGVFGRVDNFSRLEGKEPVFGIRSEGIQVAVSKNYLLQNRIALLDQFSPSAVVISDSNGDRVAAFTLPDSVKNISELRLDGDAMVIRNGEIMWDVGSGRIISGEGSDLTPVPITSSFWFAWVSFFPKTELIK